MGRNAATTATDEVSLKLTVSEQPHLARALAAAAQLMQDQGQGPLAYQYLFDVAARVQKLGSANGNGYVPTSQ